MKLLVLRALMVGNALECYDFLLYSLFVSILSPLFFPSSDPLTALMMGFSVFAVGYAARPIGALIFGHWGDKYGRKQALFGTLLLMAFSTIGIGLLPVYEKIGILAPLFLVLFRFLQGLSAGGETSGAAVFGLEQTIKAKRGLAGALIRSSTAIGSISAILMGLFFTNEFMPEWTWRIPFCLGGFIAFAGLYLRRSLNETMVVKPIRLPLLDVIQNHPLSFLKTVGVGGFVHVPFYVIAGYMNPTLHAKGVISSFELMLINMCVILTILVFLPIMGFYSDKVGQRRMMVWGAIGLMALSLPLFMVYTKGSLLLILLAQMSFIMVTESFEAPSTAYLYTLFPAECRYSGVAFGTCIGTALFGGTTPLICTHLATLIDPLLGPSLYVTGTALIGLLAVRFSLKKESIFASS